MAKSKNHTAHNQNKKDHKNGGIKKPNRQRYRSLRGCDRRYRKDRKRGMKVLQQQRREEKLKAQSEATK